MLIRLAGFLRGAAGVTPELCRFIGARLNDRWSPVVPNGPYGAAGEIGPLAHLFQTFVGEGSVLVDGVEIPAGDALRRRGVEPYQPSAKEGLALVNGSPFATALGIALAQRGRGLVATASVTAALGVAVTGSGARALSPRVGRLAGDGTVTRVQRGLASLLADEDVWGEQPQPPVSTRVLPQVHGAALDAVDALDALLDDRLRGTTDSPVYLEPGEGEPGGLYPSGAFHAVDVVLGLELLALAASHVLNLLEKRLHRLLDARFSGLPDQLTTRPGAQAGAVALHKTVVGLAAESRTLAAPASVHALDTSSGQEDVQSLCFLVASRVADVLDALENALACELVALRQAAHLAETRPAGAPLRRVVQIVADAVPPIDRDRTLSADVLRARALVWRGENNIHSQDLPPAFLLRRRQRNLRPIHRLTSPSPSPKSGREHIARRSGRLHGQESSISVTREFSTWGISSNHISNPAPKSSPRRANKQKSRSHNSGLHPHAYASRGDKI